MVRTVFSRCTKFSLCSSSLVPGSSVTFPCARKTNATSKAIARGRSRLHILTTVGSKLFYNYSIENFFQDFHELNVTFDMSATEICHTFTTLMRKIHFIYSKKNLFTASC